MPKSIHKLVEEAKAEARKNLTGEDLEKCLTALDNWERNVIRCNEKWEDYKPAEPLIKDKKIRKAVRAWAEANGFLDEIEVHALTAGTRFSLGHYDIEFMGYFIYDLEANKTYTIDELCGEEEE